ncbi:DedA family protein [Tengunoibacter tsumagoiensis]|uniref:VTT domain-containing protein n=1 Tax=Tengunoibacter tsumagoiensis TaxID=2014871 RepID=A0A401ZZQ4_9CHLR|nr:DedA family protein [Tengunoibacter tsumagoiensis]GCE12324.1 hypothetical protein KTT_21830 [Tengunoibacter tsumagoiensis]
MHTVTHFFLSASPLLVYILVAVVLMLESSAIPIANNTLLLLTGALSAHGQLNIVLLFVAAVVGSIAGACLAYQIGLSNGPAFLARVARLLRLNEQKIGFAERWYQKSGARMIFISRMTPYVRPFACFPAGIFRMPFPTFFLASFSGSTIWCLALLALGWFVGDRYHQVLRLMQRYTLPSVLVVVVLLVLYILGSRLIKQRFHSQGEARGSEGRQEYVARGRRYSGFMR